jgi:hypothetical protein
MPDLHCLYGSTERLEQNLQAVLFDQEPHMPSRSVKDAAVAAWLKPAKWVGSHRALSAPGCSVARAGIPRAKTN